MMKQHKLPRALALLLGLLLACAMPLTAFARTRLDPAQPCSLTVVCQSGTTPLPGVTVDLTRVADVNETGDYTLAGAFANCPVTLQGLDTSDAWDAAAQTLAGYAAADAVAPTATAQTDNTGAAAFANLQTGLYLVTMAPVTIDRTTYTFTPFLASLPQLDADDAWVYDGTAYPKSEEEQLPDEAEYKVVKHWMDENYTSLRPDGVTIEIYKDGVLYDTVTLNPDNDWTHTWTTTDTTSLWQVVERGLEDLYTVTVTRDGVVFVVTNTIQTARPTPSAPPDNPPATAVPTPSAPAAPLTPTATPAPAGDTDTTTPAPTATPLPTTARLPQTGQLWWPVPLLACAGVLLVSFGWAMNRKGNKKHD